MFKKLDEVENHYEQIQQRLMEPGITDNQKTYRQLVGEFSSLEPVVVSYRKYKKIDKELASNRELLETEEEEEIRVMAKEEIVQLESSKKTLIEELKILLLPKDLRDDKNVIMEIRAGAGEMKPAFLPKSF